MNIDDYGLSPSSSTEAAISPFPEASAALNLSPAGEKSNLKAEHDLEIDPAISASWRAEPPRQRIRLAEKR